MIDQRSLVSGRTRSEHVPNLRMETGERSAQNVHIARGGPRFKSETRFGLTGHKIDFASVGLDIVDDDVAIRSPPFGAIVDLISVQQRCREYGAVGDAPGKSRRIPTEQRVPDYRVNTIGTNHGIGAGIHAISEIKPNTAIRAPFERDKLMIESQHVLRYDARQGGVEIAAVR